MYVSRRNVSSQLPLLRSSPTRTQYLVHVSQEKSVIQLLLGGAKERLGDSEHWLLLQRTTVQFPALIWRLTTVSYLQFQAIWRPLLASTDTAHMWCTDIHRGKINIKKLKSTIKSPWRYMSIILALSSLKQKNHILRQTRLNNKTLSQKVMSWVWSPVVQFLPSMCKAICRPPSTEKKLLGAIKTKREKTK